MGTVDFIPNPDFTGTDSFNVTVTDNGTTNGVAAPITTTLTITVLLSADQLQRPVVADYHLWHGD